MTATPTGAGPKRSASVASRTAAERPADGEARGSQAAAQRVSGKKRRMQSKLRTTGGGRGIEGKQTTPSLSIGSDFARTTGVPRRSVFAGVPLQKVPSRLL